MPGQVPWTLRPVATRLEPGEGLALGGIGGARAQVDLTLQIVDVWHAGALVDEVRFECTLEGGIDYPSSEGRLRRCGQSIGERAANYVRARTGVE